MTAGLPEPTNAAERALRGLRWDANPGCSPVQTRELMRCDHGKLIMTAKLNDIDPRHGSPTCCAHMTTLSPGGMSFCPGTGEAHAKPMPKRREPRGHMRSKRFCRGRKNRRDGRLPAPDRRLPESPASALHPAGRSSTIRRYPRKVHGTSIASFTLPLRFPGEYGLKSSTRPSPASTGSAVIDSTSSGTATPENGSAWYRGLTPTPKR